MHTEDKSGDMGNALDVRTNEWGILIVPGDSGFAFQVDFRLEFISCLYSQPQMWLPSYGPWYTQIVATVMQRRVFPRELKGNTNLQNSVSLALMKELLSTICHMTADVYADGRHLSDTLSCICILNAYYCKRKGSSLPSDMSGLLDSIGDKIALFMADFREYANAHEGDYNFIAHDPRQKETYVPVNRNLAYERGFFKGHKIFNFLVNRAILLVFDPSGPHWANGVDSVDLIYVITSTILGENVPPFMAYQFNLRAGIIALEVLMLVFTVIEFANPSGGGMATRRLQLQTLLGDNFVHAPPRNCFGRLKVLYYLFENYFTYMLLRDPSKPMSDIFPGACLLALEARHLRDGSRGKFINLAGQQFNDILDTIVQKKLILDPKQLYGAKVRLRLGLEAGLAVLLGAPNPAMIAQDILRTSFAGEDDYDRLYFLVLGCLPVANPII